MWSILADILIKLYKLAAAYSDVDQSMTIACPTAPLVAQDRFGRIIGLYSPESMRLRMTVNLESTARPCKPTRRIKPLSRGPADRRLRGRSGRGFPVFGSRPASFPKLGSVAILAVTGRQDSSKLSRPCSELLSLRFCLPRRLQFETSVNDGAPRRPAGVGSPFESRSAGAREAATAR